MPVYAITDVSGNLYIADAGTGKILTVGSSGAVVTLLSGLASPRGLALDSLGNLYYTEGGAARVSRRSSTGGITSVGSGWSIPRAVAVDASGIVYVADPGLQQVLAVQSTGMDSTGMTPSGTVTAIAGTGAAGFSGDGGTATAAQLDFPWDVAVGANGVVVVADLENNRVRALTPPVTPPSQTQTPPPAPLTGSVTVVSAASLTPGPVTAGMLLLIGGTGLSPTEIPDTIVAFGPNPGLILSADTNGILVIAPAAIAGTASVSIEVLYQNAAIATIPVAVADAAPALFADATGQAAANNQDGSLNMQGNPAARGSVVSLYGTGLGISNDPVTVAFDNYTAPVLYAGPVAGCPGLFQVNAQVPSGYAPTGDLIVTVTVGSSPSQAGVMIWVD